MRAEFPYVYVFAAEDWSSDTILIGSLDPAARLRHVDRAFRDPVTRAEAKRGGFQSPHDVFAYLLLGPDELEAFTAGSPDNTDDNARIEFPAPRDLLGYAGSSRTAPTSTGRCGRTAACPSWCAATATAPTRAAAAGARAQPAGARQGAREAELWTRRAEAAGDSPEARHARLLLKLVSTRLIAIPRSRWRRARSWPSAVPGYLAGTHPELVAKVKEQYPEVLAHYHARRYVTGYKVLEAWPEDLWAGSGQGLLAADRVPRLQGRDLRRRDRRAEGAGRRRRLRRPPARGAVLPGPVLLRGGAVHEGVDALERYIRSQTIAPRHPAGQHVVEWRIFSER